MKRVFSMILISKIVETVPVSAQRTDRKKYQAFFLLITYYKNMFTNLLRPINWKFPTIKLTDTNRM